MAQLESVFVTGATGFLGSHLIERLAQRELTISILTRRSTSQLAQEMPGVNVVRGDLRRPFSITDASTVFHLAAQPHVGHALENPARTFETNTAGTVTLLEAIRHSPSVESLIFVSTAHVYGTPKYVPIDEDHPVHALEPYAASKLAAEAFIAAYSSAYGIPTAIARLFNAYGPRQHPDFVVPSIIRQALAGDTLMLGNVSPTRDFTYVDDVVDALLRLADGGEGIYNVASGIEVSIETLITHVAQILGKQITVASQDVRRRSAAVEIERMWADISRIKALGWQPRIDLDDGLARTIEWWRGTV
ncbi:MAG TPA: GDP-mannose 4,6-dehydratase [Candidatus Bathyarchaeia archaeon]|nr:GDP-mannose 4,6-dehydratase [Candidatus Bathyarchaeia archaeon]